MKSDSLRMYAGFIEGGCKPSGVYSMVSEFYMDESVGMFLAHPSDPWQGLTRDEVATGLCLAAAALEGTPENEDGIDAALEEFL